MSKGELSVHIRTAQRAYAERMLERMHPLGPTLYDQFGRPVQSQLPVRIGDTVTVRKPARFGTMGDTVEVRIGTVDE